MLLRRPIIIAKQSAFLRELYEDKTIEGLNRYENVQELLNAIKEYVDNPENEDKVWVHSSRKSPCSPIMIATKEI